MNFSSPLYGFFLVSVFLFFLFLNYFPSNRKLFGIFFLLISSYFFYAYGQPVYLLLLLGISISDYIWAVLISRNAGVRKKLYLFSSLSISLGSLFLFKYLYFFSSIFGFKKITLMPILLTLPIGISFFTFQSVGYVVDVFLEKIEPEKRFIRYCLFLSFFPQLVAGPIVSARSILPQLELLHNNRLGNLNWNRIIYFFLMGYAKKSVIADSLAPIVDTIFNYPEGFSWNSIALGVIAYSIQIYGDFSGYTDIARGSALMFGIELPENFNMPYFSSGFSEFWKRWHITLSTWLRDYLYISLGGNRVSNGRVYINLLLTMLLGGLWHGASLNFVIWGAGHGLLLSIERFIKNFNFTLFGDDSTPQIFKKSDFWRFLFKIVRVVFVYFWVCVLWIFFRAKDIHSATFIVKKLLLFSHGNSIGYTNQSIIFLVFFLVFCCHIIGSKFSNQIMGFVDKEKSYIFTFLISIITILLFLLSRENRPFIYFVF